MVRSKCRSVVVAAALALSLASSATIPAHAQGTRLAAAGSPATGSLDAGAWSRLAGWLTDLWNEGLGLATAADKETTPPVSSSCTGDCDRGMGVDPNG